MKRKWFRLDNAALIFPAVMGHRWSNAFRLSVTLNETIDPDILSQAAADLQPRFPTFFVRLKTGCFWYYLEEIPKRIQIRQEYAYPLANMSRNELRSCCIRILYYHNRIAVEFFHSVTDGSGGLIFLQNLTTRYLEIKYGLNLPKSNIILDLCSAPKVDEVRDCFHLHSGKHPVSRREEDVYRLHGTRERDGFRCLTTGVSPSAILLQKAHEHNATVTSFLAAVMAEAVSEMQSVSQPENRLRPVKITVPVNLRRLFKENTLRNFVLAINVGFDPRHGNYSFDEICSQMTHQIAAEAVPQKMSGRIAANVNPQKNLLIRFMPLPVKNLVMRGVYSTSGERKGCITLSNLGQMAIPPDAEKYVQRFEFIIGVQRAYPNNCSVISYGGHTYINMIRSIKESELERRFFSKLVALGVPVEIEYNGRR